MAIPASLIAGASTSFSNAFNLALQTYNNNVNWHRQRAVDAENWQHYLYDNAYNSPVAQIQRLRNAGLNPALMYEGGGSVATSTTPPEFSATRDISPQMSGLPTLTDIISASNARAQSKLAESQADYYASLSKTEDQLRDERLNALVESNRNLAKQTDEIAEKIKSYADQHKLSEAQLEQFKFDRVMEGKRYMLDKKRLAMDSKLTDKQIEKLDADIQKTLAEKNVTERQYQEMIWTFAIRKAGLEKQNLLTDAQVSQAYATADKLGLDYDMLATDADFERRYRQALNGELGSSMQILAGARYAFTTTLSDLGSIFKSFRK